MKQTLSLKLGQSLTMTPQLQQAIRLLQLSALDLQQEIQTTLESNPLLEMADEYDEDIVDEASGEVLSEGVEPSIEATEAAAALDGLPSEDTAVGAEPDVPDVNAQLDQPMAEDMPVDSSWEDVYPNSSNLPAGDADYDPMANRSVDQTLADHLLWQLNLTSMAPSDRVIAMNIIDAIDPSGMLTADTQDIWQSIYDNSQPADEQASHEDVCAVLARIQEFDPIGVGARDLKECLSLQLAQLDPDTPWLHETIQLVDAHLDLLGAKDFTTLKRKTKLNEDDLALVIGLIKSLNPRPGTAIEEEAAAYIVPDVVVRKFEGRWLVELNGEATPQIRINPIYEGLAKKASNPTDKSYLRDNLQEARWFLKSLQTRHDTLLRVATKIVEVQRGFLEYGAEAMKPLILADIAEAVELHESTISRVTSRKYMATPRGVFELKYFFSSHVGTSNGGEVSSTAIRALIQKLTAEEDPRKPLSDNKIAAILKLQEINVARRTVAKYRESLSIPPSNERKQLI
jgi:RNA polymerase sigma-54 factor